MTDIFINFVYMIFPILGFCILFKVPTKDFIPCIFVGVLSWLTYQLLTYYGTSTVLACFLASCMVGLLSDISSRLIKEAATIFIIPGIICLVPGTGIYRTMLTFIQGDMDGFVANGTDTLVTAGAIAVGLLVMGSVIKVIMEVWHKLHPALKK